MAKKKVKPHFQKAHHYSATILPQDITVTESVKLSMGGLHTFAEDT